MINLNYYKITSNSDACNVFKHFKGLENKLEEIYIRYETAYHNGPYYDRITIFFDKHFDSFCKREFFYHRICLNKYRLDNIKKYKWQTTNFTFKINIVEFAHVYIERGKSKKNGGLAHGTAAPELQDMIENLVDQIHEWYPQIDRKFLLEVENNNV